ncbi:MAG: PaaI family thioesterase [Pseudomonadota bacterium]
MSAPTKVDNADNGEATPAIQDRYDEGFQVCYGCGSKNADGLQLKSYRRGEKVIATFMPREEHLAIPGVVYGGLIASLVDCHGIATGAAHFQPDPYGTPPRCVTGSLHVDYRRPTPMDGREIELTAQVVQASERKAVVDVKVRVGDELTAEGRVVAVRLKQAPPAPG